MPAKAKPPPTTAAPTAAPCAAEPDVAVSTAGITLKINHGMNAVINMIAEPTSIAERSTSPEATFAEPIASDPRRNEIAITNFETISAMPTSAPRRAMLRVPG